MRHLSDIPYLIFLILSLPILFLAAVAGWRVDVFQMISKDGEIIFESPTELGHKFTTRYIHSVELTPVEDEYRILGGRLWTWEERVRSTNAGLPFDRPEHGKFIENGKWMIFQGGRMTWKEYYYRIGDKKLGLNQAVFAPFGLRNLYEIFTGQLITVRISKKPLFFTRFHRIDKLQNAPMGVPAIESFKR
jgi:hypothetical protein